MTDPRKSLPSASAIARISACPGSFAAERGLPDAPTAESESGTRIHEYLAGRAPAESLSHTELDIAESCESIALKLLLDWRARIGATDLDETIVWRDNKRLWLVEKGQERCSGLADVIWTVTVQAGTSHALVLDYKTGPVNPGDADANLQLRTLAVLVDEHFGHDITTIDVALVQPLVTHTPSVCQYDRLALGKSRCQLMAALDAANEPDAPRVAGDHCKLCRAVATCPKTASEVETMASLTIHESGLTVSDQEMAKLRDRCGLAKKMIAAIEAEAFRRAQADPETWRQLGYEIREGSGRRSVEDVATVSERLNNLGVPWADITAACSINLGDIEALARGVAKDPDGKPLKGAALKAKVNDLLAGCVTIKTAKPSLRRIGQQDDE